MREIVTYAKLQGTNAFIPGIGALGDTLPPTNKTLKLVMYYTPGEDTIILQINGSTAHIPLTNVQIFTTKPEVVAPVVSLAS